MQSFLFSSGKKKLFFTSLRKFLVFFKRIAFAFAFAFALETSYQAAATAPCDNAEMDKECGIDDLSEKDQTKNIIKPAEGEPKCEKAPQKAKECCNDPMTCLGGSALSTAHAIGSVTATVAPGLGMALQGGGKDMSGLCKAAQALAGTGASLSTAAHMKCTGSISSCEKICNNEINEKCNDYITKCKTKPQTMDESQTTALLEKIKQLKTKITDCMALRPKAKELAENIGQFATSAVSAEICKQQSSLVDDKTICKNEGGVWRDNNCITSERDKCVADGGKWESNVCKNSKKESCLAGGGKWINNECDTSAQKRCIADGGEWIEKQCHFDKQRCLAVGGKWALRQCTIDLSAKNNCQAEGGRWINNKCDMKAKDKCVADGGQWRAGTCSLDEAHCVADGGKWELRRCIPSEAKADCVISGKQWKNNECVASQTTDDDDSSTSVSVTDASDKPVTGANDATQLSLQRETNPNGNNNNNNDNSNLGGGGNSMQTGVPLSGSAGESGFGDFSDTSDDDDENTSGSSSGSGIGKSASGRRGGGGSRLGSLGGGGRYKNSRFRGSSSSGLLPSDSAGFSGSMGGGGFSSYGNGGDPSDDYAGLGLSKKKLKELEKKQGAKRKLANESGGTHQNIFERISKRFQSLCQNKLDCR